MGKLDFKWLQKILNGTIAFSKKNAPSIITGGSILLGWSAVYIFWKQSKAAEKEIEQAEETLLIKREQGEDLPKELPVKEKVVIYAKHCWPAGLMGLGSTAGTIWAHKMDLSRLAEMYMLTQFLEGKNNEHEKLIDKLKGELPDKKVKEIEEKLFKEEFPESEVDKGYVEETGKGSTLFIDKFTGIKFRSSITEVQNGIYEFKSLLKEQRDRAIKRRFGDAFYTSDNPFPNDEDLDIYASEGLDVFLECIGTKQKNEFGEILEFRDYGSKDFLPINIVMDYKPYIDPQTGVPAVCYLRYKDYLQPTYELIERNPG